MLSWCEGDGGRREVGFFVRFCERSMVSGMLSVELGVLGMD